MQLIELIEITDDLFYADSPSYKVILSKQKELLDFLHPTKEINKIDNKVITKYIKYLQDKGNSNATINSKLAYLSKILTYAFRIDKLKQKPYIPTMRIADPKDKFLTKDEKTQMLYWCWRNRQREGVNELLKIILIGIYTGLRINNILSLTSENYREGMLYIYDKKVKKNFVLPVSNKIKYIIINHKAFNVSYRQCYYLFNLMKQDLKLDPAITIHTLRHTFCSDLVQKNISIPVIQALANHKKIQTTMRYTHLNTKQLENAINVL